MYFLVLVAGGSTEASFRVVASLSLNERKIQPPSGSS